MCTAATSSSVRLRPADAVASAVAARRPQSTASIAQLRHAADAAASRSAPTIVPARDSASASRRRSTSRRAGRRRLPAVRATRVVQRRRRHRLPAADAIDHGPHATGPGACTRRRLAPARRGTLRRRLTAARSCRRSASAARPQNEDVACGARTAARGARFYSAVGVLAAHQPLDRSSAGCRALVARFDRPPSATRCSRWVRIEGFYTAVAPDDRPPGRHRRPQSRRLPVRDFQAGEDSVMEDTHAFTRSTTSRSFSRRKWWLIVPIVARRRRRRGAGRAACRRTYQASDHARRSRRRRVAEPGQPDAALDNQERMRAMSQQLLQPAVLERVAREEQLGIGRDADDAQIAQAARERSTSSTCRSRSRLPNEAAPLDTFLVVVHGRDPARAQRIANRLATVFVDENSQARAEPRGGHVGVHRGAARASQARLAELEARLRKAKESFMGRLPEQTNANLAMVSGLQQQLETNANALRGEQDRLSMIERQIEAMQQGSGDVDDRPAAPAAPRRAASRASWRSQRELAAARGDLHRQAPGGRSGCRRSSRPRDRRRGRRRQRPEADRARAARTRPGLPPAASATARRRGCASASCSAQTPITRRRSACIRRASKRRRGSSSSWRRCSATTTSRSSSTRRCPRSCSASTMAENVERNRSGEQFTRARLGARSRPSRPSRCRCA